MKASAALAAWVGLAGSVLVLAATPSAQGLSANETYRVQGMLRHAYEVVKKEYYDPTFHGVDLEARFREYEGKMKAVDSLNAGVMMVAAFLDGLKDSHTYFQPPPRPYRVDYGYDIRIIGDDAYITGVHAGTDAVSKVRPGDRVLSVNGGPITRETLRTMEYVLGTLSPQSSTRLRLRAPDGAERDVQVTARVTQGRALRDLTGAGAGSEISDLVREGEADAEAFRQRWVELDGAMIWRMPVFFMENAEVDRIVSIARKHPALILDLRGNPGGLVDTLKRVVGSLFDRDVPIGERVGRGRRSAVRAPTRGDRAFGGKLVVLVDAASGSSSEVLARVVQLEGRGTVLGDRSAGAVMEARAFPFAQGGEVVLVYAFAVASADLVMNDGKSLERTGVTPDHQVLPSAADLAAGRDPVMSQAAKLAGIDLDPVKAGQLFPAAGR